jgi:uncharacterized protein
MVQQHLLDLKNKTTLFWFNGKTYSIMPNKLISESSPYLLQHANNPVNWYAWNEETLSLAKQLNKPIIVSIGYSACHWCHVMEHESFEDVDVAAIMNEHFINIKVDREERPDIDMVYMGAVQLMTGQGGWPLNCFALPDGRPIYGGTYFPKKNWIAILKNIADLYLINYPKVLDYANQLTDGLHQLEMPSETEEQEFNWDSLRKSVNRWKTTFDNEWGGPNKAPKFPLPNNYQFLLRYYFFEQDAHLRKHIDLTLKKMAFGGINDQLGGGFARYSTDVYWKVPHFEKMLYDNAQLISLYTQAYQLHENKLYKETVFDTIAFVERELTNKDGAFYSALDADSEGEEGKFYVWQKHELQSALGDHFDVFCDYFSVNDLGYWEHDNFVLMRFEDEAIIAAKYQLSIEDLSKIILNCKELLMSIRNKRIRPGLDNKILASWNAMQCKALAEAYLVFGDQTFKEQALKNAHYLLKHYVLDSGKIIRIKNADKSIAGFLEDYAFVIDAFLMIYLITADESWLNQSRKSTDYTLKHFYNASKNTFYYTDDTEEKLIVRKSEWSDNVIPASSSQMAKNLHKLSVYFNHADYLNVAKALVKSVIREIESYGPGYSNWADLMISLLVPSIEVAIVGKSVNEILLDIYKQAPSNVIFAVSEKKSESELLKHRYIEGKTNIYVCKNKQCLLPTDSVSEAIKQIKAYQ